MSTVLHLPVHHTSRELLNPVCLRIKPNRLDSPFLGTQETAEQTGKLYHSTLHSLYICIYGKRGKIGDVVHFCGFFGLAKVSLELFEIPNNHSLKNTALASELFFSLQRRGTLINPHSHTPQNEHRLVFGSHQNLRSGSNV